MKIIRPLLFAVLTVNLLSPAAAFPAEAGSSRAMKTARMTDAEREVWNVVEAFNRAFAANDPDRYFKFIDDDIVVIIPSSPYRIEGVKDDREEFEHSLRAGGTRVGYFQELQPLVRVFGDTAVVTYYSRGAYGPEADAKTAYLKETDVLAKRNGAWKIVHIHVSKSS
ncbi:MAG TPA: nuclear transport factor 2 family protein [Thermoanaerobaculia bacterium]